MGKSKESVEALIPCKPKSNSNGSYQKRGVKCHFVILNSVLAHINNVFVSTVGVKMGCQFNNSMFFILKI